MAQILADIDKLPTYQPLAVVIYKHDTMAILKLL